MSKCPVCKSRKGKRQCRVHGALLCSSCCGTSREPNACDGCAFFKPPLRRYDGLPRYSAADMEASIDLQKTSFPVEAAVCSLDRDRGFTMRDAQAIEIFEILLDLYAFGDSRETAAPRIAALDCRSVIDLVDGELRPYDRSTIAKVLATVRYTACRRDSGGRRHLDLLHQYCGSFVSAGVGLRRLDDGTDLVADAF